MEPLAIVPSDEILVAELLKFCPNVYHLEVYQNYKNQNAKLNYPAVVYRREDFDAPTELAGESGIESSLFLVTVISKDSVPLRKIADGITATYRYEFLYTLQTTKPYVVDWKVNRDVESVEFPIEQEDKGYKMTDIGVTIVVDTFQGDPCLTP